MNGSLWEFIRRWWRQPHLVTPGLEGRDVAFDRHELSRRILALNEPQTTNGDAE